jgi:hypothetical protein
MPNRRPTRDTAKVSATEFPISPGIPCLPPEEDPDFGGLVQTRPPFYLIAPSSCLVATIASFLPESGLGKAGTNALLERESDMIIGGDKCRWA